MTEPSAAAPVENPPTTTRVRTGPGFTPRLPDEGPPLVGPRRVTALALAVSHLDIIRRSTLRALLPRGTRRKTDSGAANRVSVKFGTALQKFDELGWIERLPGLLIRVVDRDALLAFAFHGQPDDELPATLLHPAAALLAAEAHEVDETPTQAQQRAAELEEMRRLMAAPVPGRYRGRGKVWRATRGLPL